MTDQVATPEELPASGSRVGDLFVMLAVTVLSCAVAAWMLQQMELPLWAGMIVGLVAYALLLSLHLVLRRSLAAAVDDEPTFELPDEPASDHAAPPAPPPSSPPPLSPVRAEAVGHARPPRVTPPPPREAARPGRPEPDAPPLAGAPPSPELPVPPRGSPFHFRPSREPALRSAMSPPPPGAELPRPGQSGAAKGEISVDFVEESIKKLADALNGAPAGAATGGSERASQRAEDTEAMIGQSIAALQSAARAMQTPPEGRDKPRAWRPPAAPTPPRRQSASAAPPQAPSLPARIAEALAAGRMDMLLEPIQGLIDGKPRHFQISARLHMADGAAIEEKELSRLAQGTGLMPSIDAARIVRAARVASRLGQRGRQGAVLATVGGESLTDAAFLESAAAGAARGGQAMTLVLAFAQSEVRTFTQAHARALAALAPMGFRFGIEAVTDLDMDFAGLREMGFGFVELDAPVLLNGLPLGGGRVPATDVCRFLGDFGLSLVVGRIDDDRLLAHVLGFGVMFGKGALFGGPRLVKDEVVGGTAAA